MNSCSNFYVYVLLREDGRPFYVGKGKGNRFKAHLNPSKQGSCPKSHIIRRMVSTGLDVEIRKLAEGLTEPEAFEFEKAQIAAIGRFPNGPLRNLTDGGEGPSGHKPSPQRIAQMQAQMMARMADPIARARISELHRGKIYSTDTRDKIGAAHRGKVVSAETRQKQSEAHKRIMASPEARAKSAAGGQKLALSQTPEQRTARMKRAGAARIALLSPEERSALSKKALASRWAKFRARKAAEAQCALTANIQEDCRP